MKRWHLAGLALTIAVIFTGATVLQVRHRLTYGHFAPLGLHAHAVSQQASIGIPGQTHLYWAELTNLSWPKSLVACDYVTDALEPGTEYAYGVQRWDASAHTWTTLNLPEPEWFCQPAPLSKIQADLVRRWIWPGETVRVMDFEAVGARDEFRKGDMARFIVFRSPTLPLDWHTAIPSEGFIIHDDVADPGGTPFRPRH